MCSDWCLLSEDACNDSSSIAADASDNLDLVFSSPCWALGSRQTCSPRSQQFQWGPNFKFWSVITTDCTSFAADTMPSRQNFWALACNVSASLCSPAYLDGKWAWSRVERSWPITLYTFGVLLMPTMGMKFLEHFLRESCSKRVAEQARQVHRFFKHVHLQTRWAPQSWQPEWLSACCFLWLVVQEFWQDQCLKLLKSWGQLVSD